MRINAIGFAGQFSSTGIAPYETKPPQIFQRKTNLGPPAGGIIAECPDAYQIAQHTVYAVSVLRYTDG